MVEYIERAVLMERLTSAGMQQKMKQTSVSEAYNEFLNLVNNAPAADVAPVRRGRWEPVHESEMTGWQPGLAGFDPIGGYVCAVCKEEAVYDCNDNFVLSNYCPHCGAKMGGGDNTER